MRCRRIETAPGQPTLHTGVEANVKIDSELGPSPHLVHLPVPGYESRWAHPITCVSAFASVSGLLL